MANHRIPQVFIDDVLGRTDIVSLIDGFVPLKKSGTNFSACCPFHNEKSPSFNVSPRKQFYHCFGCGASGNAISFLMQFDHLTFIEALKQLATQCGLALPKTEAFNAEKNNQSTNAYDLLEQVTQRYYSQLSPSAEGKEAINYLKKRGIEGKTAKLFEIGFSPDGWSFIQNHFKSQEALLLTCGMLTKNENGRIYDRFRNRLMFPIRDPRGHVIGFGGRTLTDEKPKYLNSPETPWFHKSKTLYGLYHILKQRPLPEQFVIVEGYMDVISLAQHGASNAVATLGTATTAEHIQLLSRYTQKIIFCFDGDNAGRTAAWRALKACLPILDCNLQIQFLFLPEGEDPDSLIQKQGLAHWNTALQQAISLEDYLFQQLHAEHDVGTIAGKAGFISGLSELILLMAPGPRKTLMLEHSARLLMLSVDQLQASLNSLNKKNLSNKQIVDPEYGESALTLRERPQQQESQKLTPLRLAIMLLIQYPHVITSLEYPALLREFHDNGFAILNKLVDILKNDPTLTTGKLLNYWLDDSQYSVIHKLAAMKHHIPENGIAAELKGIMRQLCQQVTQNEISRLLAKSNNQSISVEEKQRLQRLIMEQKHFKQSNID